MAREIEGKVLLSKNKYPSGWFGCNYLFNIYRGLEASNKYNISLKMPSYDEKLTNVQLSFLD